MRNCPKKKPGKLNENETIIKMLLRRTAINQQFTEEQNAA